MFKVQRWSYTIENWVDIKQSSYAECKEIFDIRTKQGNRTLSPKYRIIELKEELVELWERP